MKVAAFRIGDDRRVRLNLEETGMSDALEAR